MVDLTVQYRDGGKDVYCNIVGSHVEKGLLVIEESNHRIACITLGVITFFAKEEVK